MKATKIMMLGLSATLALAGCSKDDNAVDNWNGEIRLSSGVTTKTRAHGIDQQIAANQWVSVYVDDADGAKVYGNNNLKANGSGGFTDGATMYYPANGKTVSIYAIHPAIGSGATDDPLPGAAYEFGVKANQMTEADYAASDLLFSTKTDVAKSNSAVELTFYHILSKVEVALKSGNGTPDLTDATVTIESTKLKTNFNPSKTATLNTVDGRKALLSSINDDVASITIPTAINADFTAATYGEGIIIPQTIAQNVKFIKVVLASGAELYHKLATETSFESGKKYQYHIIVNLSGLTVTSTIENWEPVGAITGSAEME